MSNKDHHRNEPLARHQRSHKQSTMYKDVRRRTHSILSLILCLSTLSLAVGADVGDRCARTVAVNVDAYNDHRHTLTPLIQHAVDQHLQNVQNSSKVATIQMPCVHADALRRANVTATPSPSKRHALALVNQPLPSSYEELQGFFQAIHGECRHVARVYTIGNSAKDRPITVVRLTDKPDEFEFNEPEVKFVSNIHGDDVSTLHLTLEFIRFVCTHYTESTQLRHIIDNVDLYVIPTLNPDGFEAGTRANANGIDLNQNFPDQYLLNNEQFDEDAPPPIDEFLVEPETRAMMEFTMNHNFVLSLHFMSGSVVVAYPFDSNDHNVSGKSAPTPDDSVFRYLATSYASLNPDMKRSLDFSGGTTNGARWSTHHGGSQDWNYLWAGCMELTVHIAHRKKHSYDELLTLWDNNRNSIWQTLRSAIVLGVHGVVHDAMSAQRLNGARVHVFPETLGHWVDVNEHGEYFKLLAPGEYTLVVSSKHHDVRSVEVRVPPSQELRVEADAYLEPRF